MNPPVPQPPPPPAIPPPKPLPPVAKAENPRSMRFELQAGHLTLPSFTSAMVTRSSKLCPHFLQVNSNSGTTPPPAFNQVFGGQGIFLNPAPSPGEPDHRSSRNWGLNQVSSPAWGIQNSPGQNIRPQRYSVRSCMISRLAGHFPKRSSRCIYLLN